MSGQGGVVCRAAALFNSYYQTLVVPNSLVRLLQIVNLPCRAADLQLSPPVAPQVARPHLRAQLPRDPHRWLHGRGALLRARTRFTLQLCPWCVTIPVAPSTEAQARGAHRGAEEGSMTPGGSNDDRGRLRSRSSPPPPPQRYGIGTSNMPTFDARPRVWAALTLLLSSCAGEPVYDNAFGVDNDGDGVSIVYDCDDSNPNVHATDPATGGRCRPCPSTHFEGANCTRCTAKYHGPACDQCVDPSSTGTNCDEWRDDGSAECSGYACARSGLCAAKLGSCIAAADHQCLASYDACWKRGQCTARDGRCVAASDAECRASGDCKNFGRCSADQGHCSALRDQDCVQSERCGVLGHCTAKDGVCVTASNAECEAARICAERGFCRARGGVCVRSK